MTTQKSSVGTLTTDGLTPTRRISLGSKCKTNTQVCSDTNSQQKSQGSDVYSSLRRMIAQLLSEGFTKTELAKRLGCGKAIQFGVRPLTTRRALERMKKFYAEIMAE